jgi:hypothetical protein
MPSRIFSQTYKGSATLRTAFTVCPAFLTLTTDRELVAPLYFLIEIASEPLDFSVNNIKTGVDAFEAFIHSFF